MRIALRAAFVALALGRGPTYGQSPAGPVVRINVPAYQLELWDSGRVVRRAWLAVGDPAYPTPIGRFAIRRIIWDPKWIPPADEPWAAGDSAMGPGRTNPMGRVKLELGGGYYLHGTPDPASVGGPTSHGCVRLRNRDAIAIALYLERATATVHPPPRPDTLAPRPVQLQRRIPVVIRYDLVEWRRGRLLVHPDVYGRRTPATDSAAATRIAPRGSATYPAALSVVRALLDSARTHTLSRTRSQLERAMRASLTDL